MTELEKELEEYKKESESKIKELEEKIEKMKIDKKTGRVAKGEKFWTITDDCDISIYEQIETNFGEDDYLYEIGNYFKTKEEAEKALEKIKIYTRLKRFAETYNTEEIDFKNTKQKKYSICYDYLFETLGVKSFFATISMQEVFFTSLGLAQQAIKKIGEENIKKLFE